MAFSSDFAFVTRSLLRKLTRDPSGPADDSHILTVTVGPQGEPSDSSVVKSEQIDVLRDDSPALDHPRQHHQPDDEDVDVQDVSDKGFSKAGTPKRSRGRPLKASSSKEVLPSPQASPVTPVAHLPPAAPSGPEEGGSRRRRSVQHSGPASPQRPSLHHHHQPPLHVATLLAAPTHAPSTPVAQKQIPSSPRTSEELESPRRRGRKKGSGKSSAQKERIYLANGQPRGRGRPRGSSKSNPHDMMPGGHQHAVPAHASHAAHSSFDEEFDEDDDLLGSEDEDEAPLKAAPLADHGHQDAPVVMGGGIGHGGAIVGSGLLDLLLQAEHATEATVDKTPPPKKAGKFSIEELVKTEPTPSTAPRPAPQQPPENHPRDISRDIPHAMLMLMQAAVGSLEFPLPPGIASSSVPKRKSEEDDEPLDPGQEGTEHHTPPKKAKRDSPVAAAVNGRHASPSAPSSQTKESTEEDQSDASDIEPDDMTWSAKAQKKTSPGGEVVIKKRGRPLDSTKKKAANWKPKVMAANETLQAGHSVFVLLGDSWLCCQVVVIKQDQIKVKYSCDRGIADEFIPTTSLRIRPVEKSDLLQQKDAAEPPHYLLPRPQTPAACDSLVLPPKSLVGRLVWFVENALHPDYFPGIVAEDVPSCPTITLQPLSSVPSVSVARESVSHFLVNPEEKISRTRQNSTNLYIPSSIFFS